MPVTIDEYVDALVANSKPLTEDQIEGAARILAGASPWVIHSVGVSG